MVVLFVVFFFIGNLDGLMRFLVVDLRGFFLVVLFVKLVLFFIVVERFLILVVVIFELFRLMVDFINGFDVSFFLESVLMVFFFVGVLDNLLNFLVEICGNIFLVLFFVLIFMVVERFFFLVVVVCELLWLNVDLCNGFDVCFFLG